MTLTDNPDTAAMVLAEEIKRRRGYVRGRMAEGFFSPQALLHLAFFSHHRSSGDSDRNRTANTVRWQAMVAIRCKEDTVMGDAVLWTELKAEIDTPWHQWHKMHDFTTWNDLGDKMLHSWYTTTKPTGGGAWTPAGDANILVPSGGQRAHEIVIDFLDHR